MIVRMVCADFEEKKQTSYSDNCYESTDGLGEKQESSNLAQSKLIARGHWRPAEDKKLKEIVALYGPQNWNLIANKLGAGRSGKSCRLRWFNQLDPRINRRAFTEDEEERLLVAHRLYGNKWAMIAATLFPGRTDNAVKNHWHVIMARKCRHSKSRRRMGHEPNFSSGLLGSSDSGPQISRPIQGEVSGGGDESTIAPQFIDFLGVGAL